MRHRTAARPGLCLLLLAAMVPMSGCGDEIVMQSVYAPPSAEPGIIDEAPEGPPSAALAGELLPAPELRPVAQLRAAADAAPPAPETPAVRALEDLLRLPASPPAPDRSDAPLRLADSEDSGGQVERTKRPYRVEIGRRTDRAGGDPGKTRTQTDAGVSLDLGKATRVRGGVRVDQESDGRREDPVPTVGVERRF